jgi:hypothetical protein
LWIVACAEIGRDLALPTGTADGIGIIEVRPGVEQDAPAPLDEALQCRAALLWSFDALLSYGRIGQETAQGGNGQKCSGEMAALPHGHSIWFAKLEHSLSRKAVCAMRGGITIRKSSRSALRS